MAEDQNETLDTSASAIEQPETDQAVESEVVSEEQQAPEAGEQPAPKETPSVEPRLYAGKYKTDQELEQAYQSANAENSRMAAELARLRQPAQEPAKKTEPQYSQEQLETWKEGRLLEVSQAQTAASRLYNEGRYQEAQAAEIQARESARQIRLIDAELRKMDIAASTQTSTKQSAEARIMSQAAHVIDQYKDQLVPGTELWNKSSEFLDGYRAMGWDINSPVVQAQAVAMGAQVLGLSSKKVEQTTRKELTKTMHQALKQGVVSGAGKGSKGAAAPSFMDMSDAEFIAYKAKRGWD